MSRLLARVTALVTAVLSVPLATSAAGAVAQAGARVPAAASGATPGGAPATGAALGASLTLVTGDRVLTRLRAQVSLNGGKTWRQAQVRPAGPDRFGATFTAGPSALVSLRVTAMDTAGNSLTETILNAYRTSA